MGRTPRRGRAAPPAIGPANPSTDTPRRGPLQKAGAVFDRVVDHWKIVTGLIAVLVVTFPALYGFYLRHIAPSAYYQLGVYWIAPDGPHLRWNVELNRIDQERPDRRLAALLAVEGDFARLPSGAHVPGRRRPPRGDELPGREWASSSCLFVRDVTLQVIARSSYRGRVYADPYPQGGSATSTGDVVVDGATIRRDAGSTDPATYYLSRLPKGVAAACTDRTAGGDGPVCPRIAVWARGPLARCTLPFW